MNNKLSMELFKLENEIIDVIGRGTKGKPPYTDIVLEVKDTFRSLYAQLGIDTSNRPINVNPDIGDRPKVQFDFGVAEVSDDD